MKRKDDKGTDDMGIKNRIKNRGTILIFRVALIILFVFLSIWLIISLIDPWDKKPVRVAEKGPAETVYSWVNDVSFSELSFEEQLTALTIVSYGKSDHRAIHSVAVAPDGSVYAVGSAYATDGSSESLYFGSAVIVKYDSNLNQQNMVFFDSSNSSFRSLAIASDGSIYVVGDTGLFIYQAVIVKYDSNLNQQSTATWGGNGSSSFVSVAIAPDGSVYAAGDSQSTDADFVNKGEDDAIIVKYDKNLKKKSIASWGGSHFDRFTSVAVAPDGSVYASGHSHSKDAGAGFERNGNWRLVLIVKYDKNLKQQNVVVWGDPESSDCKSMAIASDGSIYVVGSIGGVYTTGRAIIMKYDNNLVQQNMVALGDSDFSVFHSVAIASDGSVYASGVSRSTDAGFKNRGANDAIIAKYDSNLNQLNIATWGGSDNDRFTSIAVSSNGSVYASGYSYSTDAGFAGDGSMYYVIIK